ncbi:MAG: cbb3-type cytochrome c oxidase subunit 3 [Polyangiaceae bacterium]
MKLSDIMSSMGLATYAEISLLIFFAVFMGVVFHVYKKGSQETFDRAGRMPLDDDHPQDPRDVKENA